MPPPPVSLPIFLLRISHDSTAHFSNHFAFNGIFPNHCVCCPFSLVLHASLHILSANRQPHPSHPIPWLRQPHQTGQMESMPKTCILGESEASAHQPSPANNRKYSFHMHFHVDCSPLITAMMNISLEMCSFQCCRVANSAITRLWQMVICAMRICGANVVPVSHTHQFIIHRQPQVITIENAFNS